MTKEEIRSIVNAQREYFASGETLDVNFRLKALKKLKNAIKNNIDKINAAIKADLGKSAFEGYMCETGLTLSEISYMIKHTRSFAREKDVISPIAQFPSRSYVKSMPYGVCLVMSPWNYPFLLTIEPLCDAIAAGNCVVLKPSAYSPATTRVMSEIIKETFEEKFVAVIEGGREENAHLLDEKFDYIFFTGGKTVGRLVMEKASAHLTPVTLELGGKSPCIIDKSADVKLSARRIVWGKYLNCGQTCVAPDYIYCHKAVKAKFIECVKKEIEKQFGNALENENYGKIINEKHFGRILGLIDKEKVVAGGGSDKLKLKIEPTVMDNVTREDRVMQEEIFGPVMPVLEFESIDTVIKVVNDNPKPLALYVFARDKKVIKAVTGKCAFGGGCVNDVVIHLATSRMGFGGVGESGMGSYHGKYGFDTFSHKKSIVDKKLWLDLPMRYQPFKRINEILIHMFLR
ncbi:MAG: aldehyde dehydrogenase [Clostridia bacterium]|nr:aldehyde dehydrogenase [Clostridia bacterium]